MYVCVCIRKYKIVMSYIRNVNKCKVYNKCSPRIQKLLRMLELIEGGLLWTIKRAQMTCHFQLSLQCNVSPITGFIRHMVCLTKPVMGEM